MNIDRLKIVNFRGLSNLPVLDFNLINIIVSPGSFGKTSFLQAVFAAANYDCGRHIMKTASVFNNSQCRDYDIFRQFMHKEESDYTYELSAVFEGTLLSKRMKGNYTADGNEFLGNYISKIENSAMSISESVCCDVNFRREEEENYKSEAVCCPQFGFFDFESNYEGLAAPYKNSSMKSFIEDYIACFDNEAGKLFTRDGRFYFNHKRLGDIPAEMLGSALFKNIEFSSFCDRNSGKVLLIDNVGLAASEEMWEIYGHLLLSHIVAADSQAFLTARNRRFGEMLVSIMKDLGCYDSVNFINIYRDSNDRITAECKIGENTRIREVFRSLFDD